MPADLTRNRYRSLSRFAAGLIVLVSLAGCWKKNGEAIVLAKEHIDAAEIHETPNEQANEAGSSPTPSDELAPDKEVETARELAPNEIEVDGYVMDKDARGTSKDPRAMPNEQWLVKVQLVSDGRLIGVYADKARYEKVKVGDRVPITYREGKYTGTVWSAEID